MPVPVVVAAAAGLSYWLLRRRRGAGARPGEMTYELDDALPAPVRERVLHLLALAGGGETASNDEQALRELARVLSVGYPHTARSLRRKLWELGGQQGAPPEFGVLPLGDARATGYEPGHNYSSGPLGYGTGPEGLDRGMPGAMAARVRERLVESPARVHPETSYPLALAAFADELDGAGYPVAAETIRSKANYCKRQSQSKGEGPGDAGGVRRCIGWPGLSDRGRDDPIEGQLLQETVPGARRQGPCVLHVPSRSGPAA